MHAPNCCQCLLGEVLPLLHCSNTTCHHALFPFTLQLRLPPTGAWQRSWLSDGAAPSWHPAEQENWALRCGTLACICCSRAGQPWFGRGFERQGMAGGKGWVDSHYKQKHSNALGLHFSLTAGWTHCHAACLFAAGARAHPGGAPAAKGPPGAAAWCCAGRRLGACDVALLQLLCFCLLEPQLVSCNSV